MSTPSSSAFPSEAPDPSMTSFAARKGARSGQPTGATFTTYPAVLTVPTLTTRTAIAHSEPDIVKGDGRIQAHNCDARPAGLPTEPAISSASTRAAAATARAAAPSFALCAAPASAPLARCTISAVLTGRPDQAVRGDDSKVCGTSPCAGSPLCSEQTIISALAASSHCTCPAQAPSLRIGVGQRLAVTSLRPGSDVAATAVTTDGGIAQVVSFADTTCVWAGCRKASIEPVSP